ALRNWIIDIDPATPQERYQFMADLKRDGDTGPGDKRFLQSTGPFNMRPGDTARVVVGILIAPAKGDTPDGMWEDMDSLITLDLFAQRVYDENFLAPRPPDPANVDWRPLDNGVELLWDEKSERSLDVVERGLDFAGYIIQRARKSAGPDFVQYDSVVGFNVGYKTIGTIRLPALPTDSARVIAAGNQNLSAMGPWWRLPMLADITANGRLTFNPFDDENNDSTLFNDLSGKWWNDGSWGDRFSNKAIRDIVRDAITEIMDSVTDGRTFIDVGDDNGDGRVDASSVDLPANEKLINSIDYFYRVLAFDAGSTEGNTPPKTNSGIAGINEVRATPEAPSAGLPVTPEIISQYGLGGISNFNILVLDQERLGQLFGNDTLEFEFRPYRLWDYDPNRDTANNRFFGPNWYTNEVIVRSRSLGELNRFAIPLLRGDIARPVFSDRAFVESRANNRQSFNLDSTFTSRFVYFSRDTVIKRPGEPDKDTTVVDSIYVDRRHIMATYRNTFVTEPGRLLFGTNGVTKSTLGISFDWAGQQFGDSLRFGRYISDPVLLPHRDSSILGHIIQIPSIDGADTTYRPEYRDDFNPFELIDGPGEGTPNPTLIDGAVAYGNDQNSLVLNRSIPSIGQPLLEVEFLPGGTETLVWTQDNKEYRVENVPYLIPVVRNLNSYSYEVFSGDGSSTDQDVNYDYEFPADGDIALRLNTAGTPILDNDDAFIRLVDLGEFALATYAWGNIANMTVKERRTVINFRGRDRSQLPTISPASKPIGTPNRYYVGEHIVSIDDTESVDVRFTHRLVCNGAITLIDFAGMGAVTASITSDTGRRKQIVPDSRPSVDFQAGDKFRVHFAGGALGLPQPDAKVVVAIPDPTPGPGEFTDDLLDAVRVVPNPYLVDHLGQSTTSEKVIYITRLPEKCTIEIYTAGGELVQTIEHDASKNVDGRIAVNAWDLVSRGNRQVQTQLFVARIVTPDGAETVKKFSVVVGGFRFLTR
ncbi:MAG: hypothetical protein J4G05_01055, partial [Chlorobi bacterium]|nr:hypothetical protein [Chlorobiota bacterium]